MSGGVRESALISSFSVRTRWQATSVRQDSRLRRLSSGSRIPMLSTRADGLTFSPDDRRRVYEDAFAPRLMAYPVFAAMARPCSAFNFFQRNSSLIVPSRIDMPPRQRRLTTVISRQLNGESQCQK